MGKYTDFLEDKSYDILDAENYMEELKKVMKGFRSFDAALDSFLSEHGYSGNLTDADAKVNFLKEHLKGLVLLCPEI